MKNKNLLSFIFPSKENGSAILSGLLLGLSFPPINIFPLMFFALVPYFFSIKDKTTLAEINKTTYLFGFSFSLVTLYWVGSWMPDSDPFLRISGIALLFFNPILFLIPSSLYSLSLKHFYFIKNKKKLLFLFPVFWVAYEHIYTLTDLRFPWLVLGHGLAYFNKYIQIADIIGANGFSLLVVLLNVLAFKTITTFIERKKLINNFIVLFVGIFLLPLFYSFFISNKITDTKKVRVGIIQPNFNPWKKWETGSLNKQLEIYFSLSQKAIKKGAEIIVWPESALPVFIRTLPYKSEENKIREFVEKNNISLITGMPDIEYFYNPNTFPKDAKISKSGNTAYRSFNSILLYSSTSDFVQSYHKKLLVPFGEGTPFADELTFLKDLIKWGVGLSGWNKGTGAKVLSTTTSNYNSLKIGAVICIESIYQNYVADFAKLGAEILIVVTNDSWYGNSSGPYQHEAISILRAVENRKYIVRAANGGISAVINKNGEIIKETEMYERGFLTADIFPNSEKTFFTKHPRIIPDGALIISSLIFLICIYFKFKVKRKQNENN